MPQILFGDADTAVAGLFGQQTNSFKEYLHNSLNNYTAQIAPHAAGIVEAVTTRFAEQMSTGAQRKIEAFRNKVAATWQADMVKVLGDVGQIQQAPDSMVRWVMAQPDIRQHFIEGRCEGYGDRYVDNNPGGVGLNHYDYRVATSGVVMQEDDAFVVRNHYEHLYEEERELTLLEKNAIQVTWETMCASMETDITDPTSEWNAVLG